MRPSIRVLHVDDEPDLVALVADFLERVDERLDVVTATSASDGLEMLRESEVDCVVSDHDMPGRNGIEFLEAVREEFDDLPFILFTGKGSEEIASDAIAAGVTDYLQKGTGTDQYTVLANRIDNAVSKWRAETSLSSRADQQQLVAELGQRGLAGAALDDLLDTAVERVADTVDNEYAKVLEWRPDAEEFLLRAGVGWADGLVGTATISAGDDSQAGRTLRSETPVVVEDLDEDPRFSGPSLLTDHDVVSGLSVVIGDPDDPWGVLGTHSVEPKRFSDDDVNFVQSVANVLTDTIGRQAYERELEETTDRMRLALEGANSWVWEWDLEADAVTQSAVTGIPGVEGDRATRSVEEFLEGVHPDDREGFVEDVERAAEDGDGYHKEFRHLQDGAVRWIESRGQVYRATDGRSARLIGIGTDVTERKARERERQWMQHALDQTGEAVFVSDPETATIEFVNDTACTQLGYDRDELLEMTILDIQPNISSLGEWHSHIDYHREAGHSLFEGSHVRADDTRFPVEVNTGLIEIDEQEYLLGIARDITHRRERERELQAQVERLDEFARIVSHDLRNPLNVATGRLELARDEVPNEHLDAVGQSLERMQTLIDDLLRLAREGETDVERDAIDLAAVVESCWQTVETADADLRIETDAVVRADESRIKQLLENLVRNAVEHGGEDVTVTVGDLDDGFFVEDDGVGIPEAKRATLFEREPTRTDAGTRFGLSIVRQIVESHDWYVDVTEGAAGGARFEFTGVEFEP